MKIHQKIALFMLLAMYSENMVGMKTETPTNRESLPKNSAADQAGNNIIPKIITDSTLEQQKLPRAEQVRRSIAQINGGLQDQGIITKLTGVAPIKNNAGSTISQQDDINAVNGIELTESPDTKPSLLQSTHNYINTKVQPLFQRPITTTELITPASGKITEQTVTKIISTKNPEEKEPTFELRFNNEGKILEKYSKTINLNGSMTETTIFYDTDHPRIQQSTLSNDKTKQTIIETYLDGTQKTIVNLNWSDSSRPAKIESETIITPDYVEKRIYSEDGRSYSSTTAYKKDYTDPTTKKSYKAGASLVKPFISLDPSNNREVRSLPEDDLT